MKKAPSPASKRLPVAANDNGSQRLRLKPIVLVPANLPILRCEVEVIAALLEGSLAIPANDNEEQG